MQARSRLHPCRVTHRARLQRLTADRWQNGRRASREHSRGSTDYVYYVFLASMLLAAEETGPEAAVLEGLEFGLEADAVFDEGGLLFDELEALLD
jgi:hypothetical protein